MHPIGIEPIPKVYKTFALPIKLRMQNYAFKAAGLEPTFLAPKTSALPIILRLDHTL